MPADLVSAIVAGSIITYLMYKNINKITKKLDETSRGGFEAYAAFSAKIQEYIRKIKKDIDDDLSSQNPQYFLKKESDQKVVVKELTNLIRELSFYETVLAKKKSSDEIESGLFEILSKLDSLIKENFQDGEKIADQLREDFHKEYMKITQI